MFLFFLIMVIYLCATGGIFAIVSVITKNSFKDEDSTQEVEIVQFNFLKPLIIIPAFINVICIYSMEYLENKIALYLTKVENKKYQRDFIKSFIIKR